MKILFMCVANSARSQMAEGLAKSIFKNMAWIESAGSQPKFVNPYAIKVLGEIEIDISKNSSKLYADLPNDFTKDLNYIITLCAEEVCPIVISKTAKKLHWPFQDPAGREDSEEEQLEYFRKIRDQIKNKLESFKREFI